MRKAKLIYIVLALFFAGLALAGMPNDLLRVRWTGAEMKSRDMAYIGDAAWASVDPVPEAGAFTWGLGLNLRPGAYHARLAYSAQWAGNRVGVVQTVSPGMPGGGEPALLWNELTPGSELICEFSFTLNEPAYALDIVTHYGGEGAFAVESLFLWSEHAVYYSDHLMLAAAVLLLAAAGWWWLFMRRCLLGETVRRRLASLGPVLFTLFVTALVSYPLFIDTVTKSHDSAFHLLRIESIAVSLGGGQCPPRLYTLFFGGLGYAAPMFNPDVFLWPSAVLRLLGVSLSGCYLFLLWAVNLATVWVSLWVGRRLFRSGWAAHVFCVLYCTALYRSTNLFVRGALGEALAMVFLPLAAYGIYEIFFGRARGWPFAAVGFVCLLLSHILSFTVFLLLTLLFSVVFHSRLLRARARLRALLKAAGLALLLGAFFIVPFLAMNLYVRPTDFGFAMADNAVPPAQLFITHAGFGYPNLPELLEGEPPFTPGLPLLACGFGMAALLVLGAKKGKRHLRLMGAAALAFGTLCLVLATTLTPWAALERLPVVKNLAAPLQFPVRFLSFACLFLALCGGVLARLYRPAKKMRMPLVGGVLAVCFIPLSFLLDSALTWPQVYHKEVSADLYHVSDTFYSSLGREAVEALMAENRRPAAQGEGFEVAVWRRSASGAHLEYTQSGAVEWIDLPLLWYPGYSVQDGEGNALENAASPEGLVRVWPQSAQGVLNARYTGLWWWRIGDAASVAALLGCLFYSVSKQCARCTLDTNANR